MKFHAVKKSGFTIAEVVVAIAIVAVLASVVYASFGEGRKKARDTQRISDLQQIQVALKMYRQVNSLGFPAVASGEVIGDGSGVDDGNTGIGKYLTGIIKDPLSGTSGYEYYYDSSYDCTGTPQAALIVEEMEQSNNANHGTLCGTGEDIGNGVTPDNNSYILLLN